MIGWLAISLSTAGILFTACSTDMNADETHASIIYFTNDSSYLVDIYKNYNPANPSQVPPLGSVQSGQTEMIELAPSQSQLVGDTFYFRFSVLLANSTETGTRDIYASAIRNLDKMDYLSFVVIAGEVYNKTIHQPDELSFLHGYLQLINQGKDQIQLYQGNSTPLKKMDGELYINPGKSGFYTLEIPDYSSKVSFSSLNVFPEEIYLPGIEVERGKLYKYEYSSESIQPKNLPQVITYDH